MKNLKLILAVLIGLAIISCEKEEDKIKVRSINFNINKTTIGINESVTINAEVLPADASDSSLIWSSSDENIATVVNGVVTGVAAGSVDITAVPNDGSDVTSIITMAVVEAVQKETVSAKWNVSSAGEYESFEFNKSGHYIIVKNPSTKSTNEQIVLFGTYEIIDSKTILMVGFGTISIASINENSISFSIQFIDTPGETINIQAAKQDEIETSTNTELLCRTWEMVSVNDTSAAEVDMELTVLFSEAGTYFVSFANPVDESDGGLAQWKWKNEAETQLYYSHEEVPVWSDEHYVDIPELTLNTLVIEEDGDTYILKPVAITNPVSVTISNGIDTKIGSRIFRK